MKMLPLIAIALAAMPVHAAPQVIEIPVPESPTVAIRVVIETGSVDDPGGKLGLCNLTMRAAAEGGTALLTKTQVEDLLYPLAAAVDVHVDRETTVFSGRVRREDLDTYYPIFRDLVFHPRFETANVERLRDATLSSLVNDLEANDDEALGKEALQSSLFKGTPWEHPTIGTESDLRAIQPDDVRGFHRRMVVRPLVHVGIAGSYDAAFVARVRSDLETLPDGPAPDRVRTCEPPRPEGVDVLLIDKPARSTAISIGFPHTVERGDPDYWPLYLAANAFGEHRTFHGRLQREMRSRRGLNYGDYAYLEHFEQEGWGRFGRLNLWRSAPYFSIWIRPVQPANGIFALREAVWELRRLANDGLTAEEFEVSREHVRNVSRLWEQTLQRRLGMAMDDAHAGGRGTLAELDAALDAMTLEGVNRALKTRFDGANLRAVLVCARADSIRDLLRSGKPTPIVYSGGTAPEDVRAQDAQIEGSALGVRGVAIVPAGQVYR